MESNLIKFIFIVLFPTISFTQNEIVGNFNSCHSGRTIDILYNFNLKNRSSIGIGLLYNINLNYLKDDQANLFKKRLYARKPYEFFGIHAYYHKILFSPNETVSFFYFADAQIKYSSTRNRSFTPYVDWDKNPLQLLVLNNYSLGPFLWYQQTIGLGMMFSINDKYKISQKIGWGGELLYGTDKQLLGETKKYWFEFSTMYNCSLIYNL